MREPLCCYNAPKPLPSPFRRPRSGARFAFGATLGFTATPSEKPSSESAKTSAERPHVAIHEPEIIVQSSPLLSGSIHTSRPPGRSAACARSTTRDTSS
eukprot:CAMPEP_0119432858 /NCGR_PEP_ID=MMETSP1335-20130426/48605_1 /TAXON_ID=259385 /ORGANISM="Chrysoculter rhomboideus, Strain RCC1486" /LENGTH=98 /DNA_ID=CAMNT_0007458695 /DNA_START=60 /DNA_END=352 /DNA_ORIENTATION=-